jgi:hypothetical protein
MSTYGWSMLRVVLVGVPATMSLGACGGDSKGGGAEDQDSIAGPVGPVSENGFAAAFTSTFCDSIADCCRQTGYDPSSCRTTLAPQMTALLNLRLSSPNVVYDETASANCLNAYRSAFVACTDQELHAQIASACEPVFRGTVPVGGTCAESYECATPASGRVRCDTGVCTENSDTDPWDSDHAVAGEACGGTCSGDDGSVGCEGTNLSAGTALCWVQDGLYCSNNVCVALPAIGRPCGNSNYCVVDGHCESGTCVADIAAGPCNSDDDCVNTSYCDFSANRQCTPLKANGAACDMSSECIGGQCEADRCRSWTVANAASCAGLLDD